MRECNAAWAALGTPAARATYDDQLRRDGLLPARAGPTAAGTGAGAGTGAAAGSTAGARSGSTVVGRVPSPTEHLVEPSRDFGIMAPARHTGRWVALGVGRMAAPPSLLRVLAEMDRGSMVLVGAVGHPTGCHTLATKCMEALECIRLGAESVAVALDPSAFLAADAAAVEKEMATLLKTVPEVEIGFALSWPPPEVRLEDLLLRILRAIHPPLLVVEGSVGGSRPGACALRSLRERLHRKVRLGCSLPMAGEDEVVMALEAGCAFVRMESPESLVRSAA